jgi:type II secretory pathway pseudopilin PulG
MLSVGIVPMIIGGLVLLTFVLGIVAAIAIPNLLAAINRGRQKRTIADMQRVTTAVESYYVDHGYYPDVTSIDELAGLIEPIYTSEMPRTDGWRTPLGYTCWAERRSSSEGCDTYVIASAGRNLVFERDLIDYGSDLIDYGSELIYTNDADEDIVLSNGAFIQVPEGIGR